MDTNFRVTLAGTDTCNGDQKPIAYGDTATTLVLQNYQGVSMWYDTNDAVWRMGVTLATLPYLYESVTDDPQGAWVAVTGAAPAPTVVAIDTVDVGDGNVELVMTVVAPYWGFANARPVDFDRKANRRWSGPLLGTDEPYPDSG